MECEHGRTTWTSLEPVGEPAQVMVCLDCQAVLDRRQLSAEESGRLPKIEEIVKEEAELVSGDTGSAGPTGPPVNSGVRACVEHGGPWKRCSRQVGQANNCDNSGWGELRMVSGPCPCPCHRWPDNVLP